MDGQSIGDKSQYTFRNVRDDHTILAVFQKAESINPFIDVHRGDWFHDAALYAYEHGLMRGTAAGTFSPGLPMTRAMIVTVLWRLAGEPAAAAGPFADVTQDWYRASIAWATENNIVTGLDTTHFYPDRPITREQLVAILYRFALHRGEDVSIGEETNILSYEDAFDISEYAIPGFQWACGSGLIEGSDTRLDPQGIATRAQVAAILMRFIGISAR